MTEIISVKFKSRGKTYFFDPNGLTVPDGAHVVVQTAKGLELAECVKGNHYVTDESIVAPLRPAVRLATEGDMRVAELCKVREKEAFGICEKKIAQHGLDMKLVDVECSFEGNKIMFFFTADGRVDFRALVKDLAGVFRTRIELRQIGVRDEAKLLGGLGMCGRPFCCHQFLDDFRPVSTKMAKTQSLSLNPTKISGACGRLMCCLRYEQEAYEDLVKSAPKNGTFVETPAGYGSITQVNLLRQKVKVKLDEGDETPRTYDVDEVAVVPGGRPRPGEPLPHVLKLKPKPVEPDEPEDNGWKAPDLFGDFPVEEPASQVQEKTEYRRRKNRQKKPGNKPRDEAKTAEKQPAGGPTKSHPKSGQRPGGAGEGTAQGASRQSPAAAASGAQQKKTNYRRRYYGRKPRSGGAPKGE